MSDEPVIEDDLTLEDGILFHTKKGKPREMPRPLAPLADTHGHLTSFRGHDPARAIARAALAGVRLLVVPVDPVDEIPRKWGSASALLAWLDEQVAAARGYLDRAAGLGLVPPAFEGWDVPELLGPGGKDNVRIVAGAHPYGATELDDAALTRTRELLASPRAVGVGEIGLDYGPYNELAPEVQLEAFRAQLHLAHELNMPVELHIRDANDDPAATAHMDAARLLCEEGVPEAGCDLHCFTSGPEVLAPFAELGCHIAFGGAVTFKRSDDIREAAAACPQKLLLSETDSPYMAPVPLRGEECEPAMVAFSAACVADVREEAGIATREETYAALWRNACELFGL